MDKELVSVIFGAVAMVVTGMGVIIIWLVKTQLNDIKNYFKDIVADIRAVKVDIKDIYQRLVKVETKQNDDEKEFEALKKTIEKRKE